MELAEAFSKFVFSIWGLLLLLLALFYGIVAAMVPFWIYSIRQEMRRLEAIHQRLGHLLANSAKPSQEETQMAKDLQLMRRIMTGQTTPEAEQKKAEERGSF